MIEISERIDASGAAPEPLAARLRLELTFDLRQKSRQRVRLSDGEEAALMLPRGTILRGGELLRATDGRIVEVIASPEPLLHVEFAAPAALAKAAYHLGNRHVAVEVGPAYLRLARDHVLEQMLTGLGARITSIAAAFEPESGAYAAHGHESLHMLQGGRPPAGGGRAGPRIHEFGTDGDA